MYSSKNEVIIFTFSIVSLFSDRKRYEARGSFHLLASSNVKSFRLQIDQSRQMFTIYIFTMPLQLSHSSPCHFKSLLFKNLLYHKEKIKVSKHLEFLIWISRITSKRYITVTSFNNFQNIGSLLLLHPWPWGSLFLDIDWKTLRVLRTFVSRNGRQVEKAQIGGVEN